MSGRMMRFSAQRSALTVATPGQRYRAHTAGHGAAEPDGVVVERHAVYLGRWTVDLLQHVTVVRVQPVNLAHLSVAQPHLAFAHEEPVGPATRGGDGTLDLHRRRVHKHGPEDVPPTVDTLNQGVPEGTVLVRFPRSRDRSSAIMNG